MLISHPWSQRFWQGNKSGEMALSSVAKVFGSRQREWKMRGTWSLETLKSSDYFLGFLSLFPLIKYFFSFYIPHHPLITCHNNARMVLCGCSSQSCLKLEWSVEQSKVKYSSSFLLGSLTAYTMIQAGPSHSPTSFPDCLCGAWDTASRWIKHFVYRVQHRQS